MVKKNGGGDQKRSGNKMSMVEREGEKIQIKEKRRKRKYLKIKEEENVKDEKNCVKNQLRKNV